MKVNVTFNESWLYSDGGIHASSVRRVVNSVTAEYRDAVEVERSSLSDCVLNFRAEEDAAQLTQSLRALLAKALPNQDLDEICSIRVLEETAPGDTAGEIDAILARRRRPSAVPEPKPMPEDAAPDALSRIEARVGMEEFKALCREIRLRAPQIAEHGTQRFFFSEGLLFCAGPGCGYTTSLRLLCDLLVETGLFAEGSGYTEFSLPNHAEPDAAARLLHLRESIGNAMESQRLISIDIASWQMHTGDQAFKSFLLYLFRKNRRCKLVFRLPFLDPAALAPVREDIGDVMSVRTVSFPAFTDEQLRRLAEEKLSQYALSMAEDAWPIYYDLIAEEKRDGSFYGFHTQRKVLGSIIQAHELAAASADSHADVITAETVASLRRSAEEQSRASDELDGMVGMDAVSARIREMVNQILFARKHDMDEKPCMHMCFVGNPGTGKTTAARIIGGILREKGVLRVGKFYERKGRDFCAEYVGQTAPKTTAICQSAYGSVLFIDEAYSLVASASGADYGQEAIDTLIAEMENHYDDLVVIFAGYPDEMQKLLDANPGLRSRVPYVLEFPSYSQQQLFEIFEKMSAVHFVHAPGFDERAREYFLAIPDGVLRDRRFGNGRFVRNLYERVWSKASLRVGDDYTGEKLALTVEDFNAAAAEIDLYGAHRQAKIGF